MRRVVLLSVSNIACDHTGHELIRDLASSDYILWLASQNARRDMDITAMISQMDEEVEKIELVKRILIDGYFYRRVRLLASHPMSLATEILEADRATRENVPVEDVDFSVRTFNCLKRAGINTLGVLASKTELELYPAIRNFGRRSLDEVVEKLAQYGLKLKER